MCGRYSLTNTNQLSLRFDVSEPVRVPVDPNVAPSQDLPVIVEADGRRHVETMQWGLIPHWSKPTGGEHYTMINARAETIATKPTYRVPFQRQRCLVPATGFLEWQKEGKRAIPHYFHLPRDPLFAFAGLYDTWKDARGMPHRTFAIITTKPNALVAPIHDRMPVILHHADEDRWLDPDLHDAAVLTPLLEPYPAEEMEAYTVSTRINHPACKDPALLLPIAS
jgi:putative SOS response-associated peptidase YedK